MNDTSDDQTADPDPRGRVSLRVEVVGQAGVRLVRLAGVLEYATVSGPDATVLDAAFTESGELPIVVDLAHLTYLDCCGLGVLLRAVQPALAAGTPVTLSHPQPIVARLLTVLRIDHELPIIGIAPRRSS